MPDRLEIDRRRHARFDGSEYPLRIGRWSARLRDWSLSGIGLQVKEGIESFSIGDSVELAILNEKIFAVMVFTGRVQRIGPADSVIGVEFLSEAETIIPLLVELLGETTSATSGEVKP